MMGKKRNLLPLLLKLPTALKTPLLRHFVHYPSELPSSLRFKVAETKEELEQAFTLLHDAYVAENLMTPHPSGMRVTKYHALPSTTTLIALEDDIVVGTVSLIRQSSFGLPLESIFDIENVPNGSRLAEVSSLAIKKEYLHQRGRILFPLLKYLYHYAHEHFGVSHFVIAVNPKWFDFYRSILLFKPLSKKVVENYSFVNGAPAVGGILDLNLAQKKYYQIYNSRDRKRNLSAFFQELECRNMEFPLRKKSLITNPVLSPELLEHFFIRVTDCLNSMTEKERTILRQMYSHSAYLKFIPSPAVLTFQKSRNQKRFEVQLQVRWEGPNNQSSHFIVHTVSRHGLGGVLRNGFAPTNDQQKILVNIEENEPCELIGQFAWIAPTGSFGFQITKSCERWEQYIQNLDARILKVSDERKTLKVLRTSESSG